MGFFPVSPVVPAGALIAAALAGQTIPGSLSMTGNVAVTMAGLGLVIKGGANSKIGSGTLAGGTVTIANTAVTANSRILITDTSEAGTVGTLSVSAVVPGTSFTVTSSNALDTSTFSYLIVEQS